MIIIGLTGGIGSGKTTVSNLFSELGIAVVDADIAAREVVEPGSAALQKIQLHFGDGSLNDDGSLNRQTLRERVFDNEAERHWLEELLHPLIKNRLKQQLEKASSEYAILSSPLLLETDQHQLAQRILVVDIPETLQLERASSRDENSQKQIKAIMAAQMDRKTRCESADDIILNDSDTNQLKAKVLSLHQNYLELAKAQQENS
ncbi:MAG: dephospho-CoA kinase [Pseudomonadales bacterium]